MHCFKVTWRELGNGFRSLFFPQVRYVIGESYTNGPYFAFKSLKSAEEYATEFSRYFASISPLSDLVVLKVIGSPIIPQPKRVPALYAPTDIIESWRSVVLDDPQRADELFEFKMQYFYEIPASEWIILRNFRVIEVVSAFYPEGLLPTVRRQQRTYQWR